MKGLSLGLFKTVTKICLLNWLILRVGWSSNWPTSWFSFEHHKSRAWKYYFLRSSDKCLLRSNSVKYPPWTWSYGFARAISPKIHGWKLGSGSLPKKCGILLLLRGRIDTRQYTQVSTMMFGDKPLLKYTGPSTNNASFSLQSLFLQNHKHVIL